MKCTLCGTPIDPNTQFWAANLAFANLKGEITTLPVGGKLHLNCMVNLAMSAVYCAENPPTITYR